MKLRAVRDGFIRVETHRGSRSRRIEAGQEFELPDGSPVPGWAEDVKSPKRAKERPVTSHDPKPTKSLPPSGVEAKAPPVKPQTSHDRESENSHQTI